MSDHSSLSRILSRLPPVLHEVAFTLALGVIPEAGLTRFDRIGVDASTVEADAAMRSIVRKTQTKCFGRCCAHCKRPLMESMRRVLTPIHELHAVYDKNPALLRGILSGGNQKATKRSGQRQPCINSWPNCNATMHGITGGPVMGSPILNCAIDQYKS